MKLTLKEMDKIVVKAIEVRDANKSTIKNYNRMLAESEKENKELKDMLDRALSEIKRYKTEAAEETNLAADTYMDAHVDSEDTIDMDPIPEPEGVYKVKKAVQDRAGVPRGWEGGGKAE